jgi:hypothetical protein
MTTGGCIPDPENAQRMALDEDAQGNHTSAEGWASLKATGLNPDDFMLMEWSKRTGFEGKWDGGLLYHFKHRDSRLYVYVPSKWALFGRGEDYSWKVKP